MENRLGGRIPAPRLIKTLSEMKVFELEDNQGYLPTYTRDEVTDALHEAFGLRTDAKIVSKKSMAAIMKKVKNPMTLLQD
jgi:hypothetical protein